MIMQLPNKKKRIHGAYINSDYLCVYVNYFKRAGAIEAKSSDYGRLCHIYLDCYTTNHFIISISHIIPPYGFILCSRHNLIGS